MNLTKFLAIPLLALVVAPMLGGCVVEERYPHPVYYRPYYVHHRYYHPGRRVIVVGQNDPAPADDGAVAAAE